MHDYLYYTAALPKSEAIWLWYDGGMKQFASSNSTLLVLKRGEELHSALATFARETGITSAWLSGLGGAARATLGYYSLETKSYQWQEFEGPLEILSLTGNLSMVDGEPFWHIHGSFSDTELQAVGGHVKELTVGPTCELLITPLSLSLTRLPDDETGMKLIS
jgi:predicted DNA-binding protein with PD1-like motif